MNIIFRSSPRDRFSCNVEEMFLEFIIYLKAKKNIKEKVAETQPKSASAEKLGIR